jgi:hypothetical protein
VPLTILAVTAITVLLYTFLLYTLLLYTLLFSKAYTKQFLLTALLLSSLWKVYSRFRVPPSIPRNQFCAACEYVVPFLPNWGHGRPDCGESETGV